MRPTSPLLLLATVAALASSAALLACPVKGWAAGFEMPGNSAAGLGRGMAWTVGVDDGTALAHNPGALSRLKGTRVQWSHQLVWAHERFTRAASSIPQGEVKGTAVAEAQKPSENLTPLFGLGGFVTASTDFGLPDWTFAIGGYGPSSSGHKEYDTQGGQRYMLTELDALVAYFSAAVAYGKADRYGIGATLQWATMPVTKMSLAVDAATGGPLNPYYGGNDAIATINLKDTGTFSAIAGGWLRLSDQLELGASGRVVPVRFEAVGDLSMANDKAGAGADFSAAQLAVTGSEARLQMSLAPTASVGLRWIGRDTQPGGKAAGQPRWDVELNAVWEGWSVVDDYAVKNKGKINLFAAQQAPDVTIAKRWQDTWSVRLGGTVRATEGLRVSAGGYFEQGAVPLNYSHVDFPSFDRLGVGAGLRYDRGNLQLALGYSHVFQETRTVAETYGKVYQQRPLAPCPGGCGGYSGVPANAGTFETGYDLLSWSIAWRFGGAPVPEAQPAFPEAPPASPEAPPASPEAPPASPEATPAPAALPAPATATAP